MTRVTPNQIISFTVTGRGEFPLDMLRYDQCWPSSGEGAAMIHSSIRELRTIKMNMININRSEPTSGRWSSFGWSVEVLED